MSCQERVNENNNKYNCPNRLSDGRHFTDYRPRCFTNYEALAQPMSSYDYRMYLIQNADEIMKKQREEAHNKNMCESCVTPSTMLPEKDIQSCDGRKCVFPQHDPQGLGLGRSFGGESENKNVRPSTSCSLPTLDQAFAPLI
jgi:hypothetical protein